ncbi:hypothetical protein CDAR_99951 [Caerostris darwini]|uniref:Uncharacterized protein n=1 Tax=Caerostris darwini TaxID=1538125 RepID=A0AAV4RIZ5_9ARAC|nr:hypothetical protein CDAR_99951 [Caerostris darwini]
MKIQRKAIEKYDLGSKEDEALEVTTKALKMEGTKHDLMQKSNEHDHIKRDLDLNRNEMPYSKGNFQKENKSDANKKTKRRTLIKIIHIPKRNHFKKKLPINTKSHQKIIHKLLPKSDSVTQSFLNNTTLGDFFSTPKITPMKRSEEIQSHEILKIKPTFKTNSGNNALNLSREKEDNHKQISPTEKTEKQTESVNTDIKTGEYELTSENSDIDTELEKEGLTSPKADFRGSSTTETETQYNNQDKNSNLKKGFSIATDSYQNMEDVRILIDEKKIDGSVDVTDENTLTYNINESAELSDKTLKNIINRVKNSTNSIILIHDMPYYNATTYSTHLLNNTDTEITEKNKEDTKDFANDVWIEKYEMSNNDSTFFASPLSSEDNFQKANNYIVSYVYDESTGFINTTDEKIIQMTDTVHPSTLRENSHSSYGTTEFSTHSQQRHQTTENRASNIHKTTEFILKSEEKVTQKTTPIHDENHETDSKLKSTHMNEDVNKLNDSALYSRKEQKNVGLNLLASNDTKILSKFLKDAPKITANEKKHHENNTKKNYLTGGDEYSISKLFKTKTKKIMLSLKSDNLMRDHKGTSIKNKMSLSPDCFYSIFNLLKSIFARENMGYRFIKKRGKDGKYFVEIEKVSKSLIWDGKYKDIIIAVIIIVILLLLVIYLIRKIKNLQRVKDSIHDLLKSDKGSADLDGEDAAEVCKKYPKRNFSYTEELKKFITASPENKSPDKAEEIKKLKKKPSVKKSQKACKQSTNNHHGNNLFQRLLSGSDEHKMQEIPISSKEEEVNSSQKAEIKPKNSKVIKPKKSKVIKPEESKVIKPEESKVVKPEESKVIKPEESKVIKHDESKTIKSKSEESKDESEWFDDDDTPGKESQRTHEQFEKDSESSISQRISYLPLVRKVKEVLRPSQQYDSSEFMDKDIFKEKAPLTDAARTKMEWEEQMKKANERTIPQRFLELPCIRRITQVLKTPPDEGINLKGQDSKLHEYDIPDNLKSKRNYSSTASIRKSPMMNLPFLNRMTVKEDNNDAKNNLRGLLLRKAESSSDEDDEILSIDERTTSRNIGAQKIDSMLEGVEWMPMVSSGFKLDEQVSHLKAARMKEATARSTVQLEATSFTAVDDDSSYSFLKELKQAIRKAERKSQFAGPLTVYELKHNHSVKSLQYSKEE